ncbi:MAG: hypothetical protein J0H74_17790 [Chitinophagaceae bacterium]|nr:hypothetical protein [Chitinophagaceae bacterium]
MPSNNDAKSKKPEYTVLILPSAQKQLNKLPNAIATRIEDKMMELGHDPRPAGCKKLKGRDAWRIHLTYNPIQNLTRNNKLLSFFMIFGQY